MNGTGHTADAFAYRLLRTRARELRKQETPAERVLWERLRKRPCSVKFLRQHAIGDYIVYFFAYSQRLVIEVDGAYHEQQEQRQSDARRDAFLQRQGFRVLRFTNDEVINHTKEVIQTIKDNLIINP